MPIGSAFPIKKLKEIFLKIFKLRQSQVDAFESPIGSAAWLQLKSNTAYIGFEPNLKGIYYKVAFAFAARPGGKPFTSNSEVRLGLEDKQS